MSSIQDLSVNELLQAVDYRNLKKHYKTRHVGGPEAKGSMRQDLSIKKKIESADENPAKKPLKVEVDPTTQDLQQKILAAQQKLDRIDVNSAAPVKEPYREPPSKILSASIVFIDPIRADAQDVHGAQAVQARYAQQNDESFFVKPFAKKAKDAKKTIPKVAWTTSKIIASSVRHPIATAQNQVRDPFENRDIHFAYTINEMVKKKLFPDNPEIALLIPDSFIDNLLVKGRERRNEKLSKKIWSAIKDFMPVVTTGFVYDTQQKRALEYLKEQIESNPQALLGEIEKATLEGATKLARRFSTTLVSGDSLFPNQKKIGDSQVLLPEEKRSVIEVKDETTGQDIIETLLKEKIKPFVDSDMPMTVEQKKLLIKDVSEIYIKYTPKNKPKDKLDKLGRPKGEAVVDVLALIDQIKQDPENLKFYQDHWPELKIISYVGESKGDTLGGQERFLTWNQRLSIKSAKTGGGVASGSAFPALKAVARIGAYSAGFGISYATGVSKAVPRTVFSGVAKIVIPFLGPAVAGSVAGLTETQSIHLGKFYQRRSRIDNDLARTSRGKALGEKPGELDAVRGNLEDATVETIPAETLTIEINKLILTNPNNFSSETRTPANKEEVLQLLTHMAHARARLELTMRSGSKDLDYKTSNWVSYHAGREQEELTKLTGASCQAFARLLRIQVENPALFDGLPFLPTPNGDLNEALKSMTIVVASGLKEGLPSELIGGSSPLSTFKGQKFYRQIFNASGIPESETDQVFDYINSLTTTSKVGSKTVGEWMDEAESFRSRMKTLKKIRDSRFRFAALTGIVANEIMGELGEAAQPGLHQVEVQFNEHVIQPIADRLGIAHEPQSAPPVSLDHTPTPAETSVTVDFGNYFKETADGHREPFMIWNDATGKVEKIEIPLLKGYDLVQDKNNHIDLVDPSGKTVFEDVFIFDAKHGALAPNSNFKLNDKAPPVDLGTVINFKVEQKVDVVSGGAPVELTGGAAIVEYLKTHYRDAMSEIAHRDVYNGEHALTTFVDSDGKIHITQGGYSAPNITGGAPQSMTGGLENGDGVLWFTFGKNADRPLSVDSTPLSFEGIKVPLTWHEKGNGGYGEFVFDPLHPDPNNPQEVLLAKLVDQNALNEFKTLGPDHWLNQSDLGKLWMGVRGYEGGYMSQTPDGPKMHDFEMEFAGENNTLTITPPESTTFIETTTLIPPTPIEVKIPGDTPINVPEPVATPPTPPPHTPIPTSYYSPQLKPTEGEKDAPAPATPLPKTTIDEKGFKKEVEPRGYDNQEAKNFLEHIDVTRSADEQINEFILRNVFNHTQQEFISSQTARQFIENNIYPTMHANFPKADEKIHDNITEQLTDQEKIDLKKTVLEQGKNNGLSEQEALTVNTYLVNRSYLTALGKALMEQKAIEDELKNLNEQLANASLPVPPKPSSKPNPTTNENKDNVKLIDSFAAEIAEKILASKGEMTSEQWNEIQDFVFDKLLSADQREIMEKMSSGSLQEVKNAIASNKQINDKMQNSIPFDEKDELLIEKIIEKTFGKKQGDAYYESIMYLNAVISKIEEKRH